METPKEYYYTYYSYEEWGRGYIGSRGCECLPEEDIKYLGSFKDKTFNPTQKIILEIYETREQALEAEVILHDFYDVANNPHFANKAKQTSTKFYYITPFDEASKRGKINGLNHKQNKTGVCGRSKEKIVEDARNAGIVGGKKTYELGIGIHAIAPEQRTENSKKAYTNGLGKMSKEEKSEVSKKGGNKAYELGVGVHSLTKEDKIEIGKKGYANGIGKISKEDKIEIGKKAYANGLGKMSKEERNKNCKKGGSQKWMCLETGYVSNSGGLSMYQKARGIDTSKSNRQRIA
jgi:hypothetical protein